MGTAKISQPETPRKGKKLKRLDPRWDYFNFFKSTIFSQQNQVMAEVEKKLK